MSFWKQWILVFFVMLLATLGSAFMGHAAEVKPTPPMVEQKVIVSQPPVTLPERQPVDRNIYLSGEQLCSQVAEWVGPKRCIAGSEGSEDIITCDWWKIGTLNGEGVVMWKCRDGNSRWAVLCGNDKWWHGELD